MKFAALMTAGLVSMSATANAGIFSMGFDNPGDVTLAPTQTPGAWYTDRYAPQGFDSGVMFDGDYRLRQRLQSSGFQGNRGSQDADFYNYQGRKYDVGAPSFTAVSIDLYVDSTWNSGTRAGMWTTMSNGNLTYPIIEYVVDGDNGDGNADYTGFRWWQSGLGWTETSFENATTDEWYTLDIELTDTLVNFSINGTSIGSVDNQGAHMIDNVILNAHNQGIAGEYDVYWDNFTAYPTPAPGSLALLGLGGIAATRRRR
jgi:MYXO-CTERM domain-containing protein